MWPALPSQTVLRCPTLSGLQPSAPCCAPAPSCLPCCPMHAACLQARQSPGTSRPRRQRKKSKLLQEYYNGEGEEHSAG